MSDLTNEQLTDEFNAVIEKVKGGDQNLRITLERGWLGGTEFTRIEYPRYGLNGRELKPEKALSAVIVAPWSETLAMLGEALKEEL